MRAGRPLPGQPDLEGATPVDRRAGRGPDPRRLGTAVVPGEVTAAETAGERLSGVCLVDGRVVAPGALVVAPRLSARAGILASLGLEPAEQKTGGVAPAGPTGVIAVPGV